MKYSDLTKNSNRTSLFIVLLITIVFGTILVFSYTNLRKNEIQRDITYKNRFQSRLLFKSIAGLIKTHRHLTEALYTKSLEDIIKAETHILSAISDYKIYVSEKNINNEIELHDLNDHFEKLKFEINALIETETIKPNAIYDLIKHSEELSTLLYNKEADIWKIEVLRYNEMGFTWEKNRIYFYLMLLFFIISEIGLIYFTILRIKLLNELNIQQEKLMISTRLSTLGEMSAELAHEINNPLMIISGRLKLFNDELAKEKIDRLPLIKNIEAVNKNIARIQHIVKRFKTLSKNGDHDLFESVSINKLYNEIRELIDRRLQELSIQLHFSPEDCETEIKIKLIPILQVFTNLINNSVHALENQSTKWIKIDFIKTDSTFIFKISDSGPGIKKEDTHMIFDAFFTTKNSKEGTGLGLSICQKIIKEHKGKIYYNSLSEHTEFIIELPL